MSGTRDPQTLSARLETLLDAFADPDAQAIGEELTGVLVEYYGEALRAIVERLDAAGETGQEILQSLVEDKFLAAVLILHDLHPEPLESRVAGAIDSVRPYLGSHAGGVEIVSVDDSAPDGAVVTLHLSGSCDGCPSSLVTVKTAIERAIFDAAPEVAVVEVENLHQNAEPTLLQIQPCPTQELATTASA